MTRCRLSDDPRPPTTVPLYHRLLGNDFERLPPVLKSFHRLGQGVGSGRFTVRRGNRTLHRMLAAMFGLPREGTELVTRLDVRVEGEREIWLRRFGDVEVASVQWQEGDLLIEKMGTMLLAFRLSADESGMRFHFDHARMLGLRLPRWLSPRVRATVRGGESSWFVEADVSVPGLGSITSYKGELTPR